MGGGRAVLSERDTVCEDKRGGGGGFAAILFCVGCFSCFVFARFVGVFLAEAKQARASYTLARMIINPKKEI